MSKMTTSNHTNKETRVVSYDLWDGPTYAIVDQKPTIVGPNIAESEKYPALKAAWDRLTDEYEIIRKLTLGQS